MKSIKLICKDLAMSATDKSWFQTFPAYGRYAVGGTVKDGDPEAVFVFDENTAKAIVDHFHADREAHPDWPGILVDREHFSEDPDKTSDAMAWATDIRVNPDGSIWTKWQFTYKGSELWENKVLVNRSPAFDCTMDNDDPKKAKEFRPFRLVSIGMTNVPHFQTLSSLASARANGENGGNGEKVETSHPSHPSHPLTNPKKENPKMDKIIEALGLQPGATEDEILGAVNALKDKASAAEAQASECQKKCTEAEEKCEKCEAECRGMKADAFVAAHAAQLADPAKCREVYMRDPALAEQMLACCRKAETPATTTQQVLAAARKPAATDRDTRAAARDKAVADYRAAHGCDFNVAWAACRDTNPELFAD